jgi:hypothetical protein
MQVKDKLQASMMLCATCYQWYITMIVLNFTMYNIMCKFSENLTSIQKKHGWTFVAHDCTKGSLIMSTAKRRKMSYMYL